MQEKVSAQYKNEIEMAKAQRDFELKKAAYDIEVNTKKAESEMAYQLQVANYIHIIQWWSVTKYNYFVTVLKYIFQVSVLYWSSFILSNFYFYFTTFQSIRSYFLLHYIS